MKILIATDGTQDATQAVEFAARLAVQTGSALSVCFAVDYVTSPAFLTVPRTAERPPDVLRDEGMAALDDARRVAAAEGITPHTELLDGKKISEILRHAYEVRADLVVTGSSGRAVPAALLHGSTAVELTRRGKLPVIAVPPHDEPALPVSRIAVAVDGSAASHCALIAAVRLARACGAGLDLAHVVDLDRITGSDAADEASRGTQLLSAAALEARENGVSVRHELLEGERTAELLRWVRRSGDSLLAMGTHRSSGLARLGSLAEGVLAEAALPVLLHS